MERRQKLLFSFFTVFFVFLVMPVTLFSDSVSFVLEIKDASATDPTVELVAEKGDIENTIVACASLRVLRHVRSIIPELPTGFIISESTHTGYGFNVPERAIPVIDIIMPYWRIVRHHFIDGCRRYSLPIYAWLAIFDEKDGPQNSIFARMAELGVDGLTTTHPKELRAYLNSAEVLG